MPEMSRTNCINCGAAKEVSDLQCPFCGTKYVDLTTIDMITPGTGKIYVQIMNRKGKPVTAKAYVTKMGLEYRETSYDYHRDANGRLMRSRPMMHVNGNIEFALYEGVDEG